MSLPFSVAVLKWSCRGADVTPTTSCGSCYCEGESLKGGGEYEEL